MYRLGVSAVQSFGDEFAVTPTVQLPESCALGCYITVKMLDSEGFEVGCLQEKLPVAVLAPNPEGEPLQLKESEFEITAEGEGFSYLLSKQTGMLVSVTAEGAEQLLEPAKLSFFRATTDNDRNIKALWDRTNIWQGENFDCTFTKIYSCTVSGNIAVFAASAAGVSRKPFFNFELAYEFFAGGEVKVTLNGRIRENVIWLPRLGFEFKLPYNKDSFTFSCSTFIIYRLSCKSNSRNIINFIVIISTNISFRKCIKKFCN